MSYRNPRFSYIHTLRETGDAGFLAGTDTFQTATPRTRLLDNQSRVMCGQSDSAQEIVFEKKTASAEGFSPLHRVIIPAGHNYGMDRAVRLRLDDVAGGGTLAAPPLSDGSTISRVLPSSHHIIWDIDTTDALELGLTLETKHWASLSGDNPSIGELWWTNIAQPTTGIAREWDDFREPTITRTRSKSGATYTSIDGDPRRRFTLEHRALTGTDLALYDDLVRRVGYGAQPFWYEHPDSGDEITLVNALADDAVLTAVGGTKSEISTGAPDGAADCVQLSNTTGAVEAQLYLDSTDFVTGVSTDWRNSILQFDCKVVSTSSWVTATSKLYVDLVSSTPNSGSSKLNYCAGMINAADAGNWFRVQVDLEDDRDSTIDSSGGIVDLSDIARVDFRHTGDVSGRAMQYSGLQIIDKDKRPVLVELEGYRRRQDNPAPLNGAGTYYTVELDLVEVTT